MTGIFTGIYFFDKTRKLDKLGNERKFARGWPLRFVVERVALAVCRVLFRDSLRKKRVCDKSSSRFSFMLKRWSE